MVTINTIIKHDTTHQKRVETHMRDRERDFAGFFELTVFIERLPDVNRPCSADKFSAICEMTMAARQVKSEGTIYDSVAVAC